MAFKELDDKLNELQSEVGKVKAASEHIGEARKAAEYAADAAETLTKEYGKHLSGITEEVDKILTPHKELLEASKNLVDTISSVDFPNRLDKIEKKIRMILILAIAIGGVSFIGLIFTLVIFFTK